MSLRGDIQRLAKDLEREDNAAHDLWTWLPSYAEAKKAHGDYASEHTPSIADVMIEASTFIAHGLHPTPTEREEAGDIYLCPCGEPHDDEPQGETLQEARFEHFVRELQGDIGRFARYWAQQHKLDPERYPMSFPKADAGAWFKQFMTFISIPSPK